MPSSFRFLRQFSVSTNWRSRLRRAHREDGFTLIELLVVLVILGLLIGLVGPQVLNYLSSAKVQAQWHQDTGYLPITTAAYDLTKEQGFYEENPGTDIAILQMTGKAPTENSKGIRLGNFDQIRAIIDEELEAVWQGQKDARTALDEAVNRGNELLRRFEQSTR